MMRGLGAGAAALLLALTAGCTVPVAPTDGRPPPSPPPEAADPARRAQVRLELAAAYFSRGQATTALEEVKLALAAKPDLPEGHSMSGLIYATLGELTLAEQSFQRALQLNPRDADTMQNYGWFLCQQRRFPEADQQFNAAMAQPQYRDVVRTLGAQGVCMARAGRSAEAERVLTRSYEMDPANPNTAYTLSEVLFRSGDLVRARFYIQRVNAVREQSNAQTLWLATRIENRMGNTAASQALGRQLIERFPQSPEALQFERGRFDD